MSSMVDTHVSPTADRSPMLATVRGDAAGVSSDSLLPEWKGTIADEWTRRWSQLLRRHLTAQAFVQELRQLLHWRQEQVKEQGQQLVCICLAIDETACQCQGFPLRQLMDASLSPLVTASWHDADRERCHLSFQLLLDHAKNHESAAFERLCQHESESGVLSMLLFEALTHDQIKTAELLLDLDKWTQALEPHHCYQIFRRVRAITSDRQIKAKQ